MALRSLLLDSLPVGAVEWNRRVVSVDRHDDRWRLALSGGQEAFFEGHEHAFRVLGGVPTGKIRYDNLKSAVAQVIGFRLPLCAPDP